MSHNWTAGDLASALRTETVSARDLRRGDIIVPPDYGPWQVAHVRRLPEGRVDIRDEDDNGIDCPGDAEIRIVIRLALRAVAPLEAATLGSEREGRRGTRSAPSARRRS